MSKIKINQADLTAALVAIVGYVVAFVPQMSTDKEIIIAAGTTAIAVVFRVAKAVEAVAHSHISLSLVVADLKASVEKLLEQAIQPKAATRKTKPAVAPTPAAAPAPDTKPAA